MWLWTNTTILFCCYSQSDAGFPHVQHCFPLLGPYRRTLGDTSKLDGICRGHTGTAITPSFCILSLLTPNISNCVLTAVGIQRMPGQQSWNEVVIDYRLMCSCQKTQSRLFFFFALFVKSNVLNSYHEAAVLSRLLRSSLLCGAPHFLQQIQTSLCLCVCVQNWEPVWDSLQSIGGMRWLRKLWIWHRCHLPRFHLIFRCFLGELVPSSGRERQSQQNIFVHRYKQQYKLDKSEQ